MEYKLCNSYVFLVIVIESEYSAETTFSKLYIPDFIFNKIFNATPQSLAQTALQMTKGYI